MLYVSFGIISAISFGLSNVYWKAAARDVDYSFLVLFRGIIASAIFGLFWLALALSEKNITGLIDSSATLMDFLRSTFLCIVCSLGLVFFLKSMKYTKVSISIVLSSVNIFGILTTVLIVGERFNFIYAFSFIFTVLGILYIQKINFKSCSWQWNNGATFALLASFFWGLTYPLFKFASQRLGALPLAFILETTVTLSGLAWVMLSRNKFSVIGLLQKRFLKHYVTLAFFLVCGTIFFNLAIQRVLVLNLNIIGNFQFIVSIVMSVLMYREKITLRQFTGIVLIFLAIAIAQYNL